jgi:mutator protein MutT
LAGFWEFPGGKLHHDETLAQCLKRELLEELNIKVDILDKIFVINHSYPEKSVEIHFFRCRLTENSESVSPLENQQVKWVEIKKLPDEKLLPADTPLAHFLASAYSKA